LRRFLLAMMNILAQSASEVSTLLGEGQWLHPLRETSGTGTSRSRDADWHRVLARRLRSKTRG
ncbi:MAG: hypothetical protein AAF368_12285, partial [Planctomycetota bacterium]